MSARVEVGQRYRDMDPRMRPRRVGEVMALVGRKARVRWSTGRDSLVRVERLIKPATTRAGYVLLTPECEEPPEGHLVRRTIEWFLAERVGAGVSYTVTADGDTWSFWVLDSDTTSYVHEDMSVEWYGTAYEDEEVA